MAEPSVPIAAADADLSIRVFPHPRGLKNDDLCLIP